MGEERGRIQVSMERFLGAEATEELSYLTPQRINDNVKACEGRRS